MRSMSTSADVVPSATVLERLLLAYARWFPVMRGKLRVVDWLWRTAARNSDTHRIARLRHGDFRMPCDLSSMLQRQIYFFGTYQTEAHFLDIWEHEAKGARMVFDVGANAGVYSLATLAANEHATVHAFEPTPEIASRLRDTVALNELGQLHVHELAVFSENGRASLRRFRGETGANEGMNFITATRENETESVATVSLDSFCDEHGIDRIDLLKLDIQGQEHRALAGASRLLRDGRIGTVFTELNWNQQAGEVCPATESIRILEQAGYLFAKPATPLRWTHSGPWMRDVSEVIARG